MDWAPLEEAGLDVGIKRRLTQTAQSPNTGIRYDISDWVKFFAIEEPVFVELCLEFFSTVEIHQIDTNNDALLSFRLGGQERLMSLMDVARCLDIYSEDDWGADYMRNYLWKGERFTESIIANQVWARLSRVPYKSGGSNASAIKNMELRLIQRFLSHSITGRDKNTEKVTNPDLWYLIKIKDRAPFSIPYGVAHFLRYYASGKRQNSKIAGGYYVTKIAKNFKINLNPKRNPYTLVEGAMTPISAEIYTAAKAIRKVQGKFVPYEQAHQTAGPSTVAPPEQEEEEEEFHHQEHSQGQPDWVSGLVSGMNNMTLGWGQHQSRFENFENRFDEFQTGIFDRLERIEYDVGVSNYNSGWLVHNQQMSYNREVYPHPTPYYEPPPFDDMRPRRRAPVYDREAAWAELQAEQQRQQQQSQSQPDYSPYSDPDRPT